MKDFDSLPYWNQIAIDKDAAVAAIAAAIDSAALLDRDLVAIVGDVEIHFALPADVPEIDLEPGETLPQAIWSGLTQKARDHL